MGEPEACLTRLSVPHAERLNSHIPLLAALQMSPLIDQGLLRIEGMQRVV